LQSKQEIEQILSAIGARPDKKLGQNFLIDKNLIKFLLDKAAITKQDIVIEIGPGTGTMTDALCELSGALVAVEYDKLLSQHIKARFEQYGHVTVIQGDALYNKNRMNEQLIDAVAELKSSFSGSVMLVANLPYNIAASAMTNLIVDRPRVDSMYVTIQKEVAERMAAPAGDKNYGPLSVIMQVTGKVTILKKLPHSVFWPAPNVESAMVSYVRSDEKCAEIRSFALLREAVSLLMGHRRKTINACTKFASDQFKALDWPNVFAEAGLTGDVRGETVGPEQYKIIANKMYDYLSR
jgi:16S rRNA (adenine1518-N6/adenine1519-N6)-dimethyltransferase